MAACSSNTPGNGDGPATAQIATAPPGSVSSDAAPTELTGPTLAPPANTDLPATTSPPPAQTAPRPSDSVPTTTTIVATEPTRLEPIVGEPRVSSELVGTFDQPVDLVVRPGDAALYVIEKSGRVIRFDETQQDETPQVVFDVVGQVSTANEQGLLGLAFSPDGSLAYVNLTDPSGSTRIDELVVGADGTFDVSSRRNVITVEQPFDNHNGGDLAFGPDGMLYIPLGDGGSGGDPLRHSGNPATLLGSVLRIDPTPEGEAPYSIPADNPFADGLDGAPEVWAWGLRNPWKIAFDPVTFDLWIADVGQRAVEEVNRVPFVPGLGAGWGVNFGWSALEGDDPFNDDVPSEGATAPVLTYRHDDGCSISGGEPYRGAAIAELEPAYVYSDFCTGSIWALDLAGSRNLTLLTGFVSVAAVRAGPDGELYVLELGGGVHRLIPG